MLYVPLIQGTLTTEDIILAPAICEFALGKLQIKGIEPCIYWIAVSLH